MSVCELLTPLSLPSGRDSPPPGGYVSDSSPEKHWEETVSRARR